MMDPKSFYNETMPTKYGADYEHARWGSSPRRIAQRRMMELTVDRLVVPRVVKARRILEIGPGPGTWTKMLLAANPHAHYTLVDISNEMLHRAYESLGARDNIEYREGDFVQLPLEGSFDVIFSSRAIEYMPDKHAVVQKIATLLAPHGSACIVTKTPKHLFDRVLGRTMGALHQGQISPLALRRLFRKTGLSVQTSVAIANVPIIDSPRLNEILYHFLRFYPMVPPCTWFSESYIVVAEK